MSEAERKRRLEYREKRKLWIIRQTAVLAALLLITVILSVLSVQFNKAQYIDYKEYSKIEYGVYVKENSYYEDSYLGKEYEYVASLIDKVAAEYIYNLAVGSDRDVSYEYTYRMDAVLQIVSNTTGKTIFSTVDSIVPAKTLTGNGREVIIRENVMLDYGKYNELASDFVIRYGLREVESNILLQMHVDIAGSSAEFADGQNKTAYVASLAIPLTTKTVNVQIASDTPAGEGKLPAYTNRTLATVFRVLVIVFVILCALLAIFLVCFIYLTRNTDITYEIRVKRLVRDYRSYIQKLKNDFDTEGYQILMIDSFNEMLEVRDIIQSPILMCENGDRTRTEFLIPTDTKLLYVFEIKVDDYDALYATQEDAEQDGAQMIAEQVAQAYDEDPTAQPEEADETDAEVDIVEEPVEEAVEEPIEEVFEEPIEEVVEEPVEEVSVNEDAEQSEEEIPAVHLTDDIEELVILSEDIDTEAINEALAQPAVVLSEIDFVQDDDDQFAVAPEEDGVEVVGVIWPEKTLKNKVYRYDPNGEELHEGDTVLVPTTNVSKNKEVIRQAAVAHGNHRVDPAHITHPLKKIIGVIRRKAETMILPEEPIEKKKKK